MAGLAVMAGPAIEELTRGILASFFPPSGLSNIKISCFVTSSTKYIEPASELRVRLRIRVGTWHGHVGLELELALALGYLAGPLIAPSQPQLSNSG